MQPAKWGCIEIELNCQSFKNALVQQAGVQQTFKARGLFEGRSCPTALLPTIMAVLAACSYHVLFKAARALDRGILGYSKI